MTARSGVADESNQSTMGCGLLVGGDGLGGDAGDDGLCAGQVIANLDPGYTWRFHPLLTVSALSRTRRVHNGRNSTHYFPLVTLTQPSDATREPLTPRTQVQKVYVQVPLQGPLKAQV